MLRYVSRIVTTCVLGGALVTPGSAQEWPKAKPVTFIVPAGPGGGQDLVARVTAEHLSKKFNASFVVENRAGAAGSVGAAAVARAAPDGYTFMVSTLGPAGNNKYTQKSLPYDPETDFTPIMKLSDTPLVIIVRKDFPANTIQEFFAYAKANPDKVNAGHPGAGTLGHIALTAIADSQGVQLRFVPYRSGASILGELMANNIDVGIDLIGGYVEAAKTGQAKVLAVAAQERSPALPNVPTMRESGINFVVAPWYGLHGPKGLPRDIVMKMNSAITEFLNTDEKIRKVLADLGQSPRPGSPEEFQDAVRAELGVWVPIIKKYNIQNE